MGVVRAIFYPGEKTKNTLNPPDAFPLWMTNAFAKKLFPEKKLEGLKKLADDLHARSGNLLESVKANNNGPNFSDFDKLATFFEEFINLTRRLEKEYYLGISGIDSKTGLRSSEMFFKDVGRELERLERQGKSFCLALVQIDNFLDISARADASSIQKLYTFIADIIKKSIRSFDDAYSMDNGTFIISLKQTGMDGGVRALQRLNELLLREKTSFKLAQVRIELTLSSCVSEPLPGDDVDKLIKNMKNDLVQHIDRNNVLIQYTDVSPLERMAKSNLISS
jgi:diguanylate cyclase (GGDEF)-like protein